LDARIPIRGLVIALSGVALVLPSTAAAGNGGMSAPSGTRANPSFALSARHALFLGRPLRITGSDRSAAGRTVNLQARRGASSWHRIASVAADRSGAFAGIWRPTSAGEFQVRGVLAGAAQASAASSSSAPRTVVVYKPAIATWYGPGFYGRRTACGLRLTRNLVGVAHRRLACGTRVEISYRGHALVAPVIDRGPYTHGVQWDLTGAAAKQLGMMETGRIGAAPLVLSLQPPGL
jgi:rare lipoprotein A